MLSQPTYQSFPRPRAEERKSCKAKPTERGAMQTRSGIICTVVYAAYAITVHIYGRELWLDDSGAFFAIRRGTFYE